MKRPSLEELTLKEKVGQLLMVKQGKTILKRVDGELCFKTQDEIDEIMTNSPYGCLWADCQMYLNNINLSEDGADIDVAASKRKIKKVQSALRIPMLVGIDCENGAGRVFTDATVISNPLTIAAADDEELTYKLSLAVAREIKAGGANWRWTPIADISNRYTGVSVGRCLSDDPDTVIKHARAIIRGTENAGVASTVKHFPGLDPYEIRDAHIVPVSVNIPFDEWWNTQAKTFKAIIDAGVDTVMVGHTSFPAVDDTYVNGRYIPATLSSKILNGLLREKMGFDGVIITDGVAMAGLTNFATYEECLVMAINAGNDVLLGVCPEDYDYVYQAVLDGRIPMERIDESAERVLKLKEKLGLFDDEPEEEFDMTEQSRITAELDRQIAEKGITLVCDRNKMIPLNPSKIKKVTIVCSSHQIETKTELGIMKSEFEKRGATVKIIDGISDREFMKALAESEDLIVYAGYIAPHRPMGMPSLYGEKFETYINAFTYGKEKSVGVSMGYPYMHIDIMAGANTFFNLYSTNERSQVAFVKALYGEIEASTNSPVDIKPQIRKVFG